MKKRLFLFSLVAFISLVFTSACGKSDSSSSASNGKYEAEVGYSITVDSHYNLYQSLNNYVFWWGDVDEGEKPKLRVNFTITEPAGNSDEENQTFSNRYSNGQYATELNSNIVSAKFEDEKQLYDVKKGDELKIITTIKKSEKYNFDYFTQSDSNENIEVKEDGDNILVISKIIVGEDDSYAENQVDEEYRDDSEELVKYTSLSEYKDVKMNEFNEDGSKVLEFNAEEVSLTEEYPFEVPTLFFANYTYTYVNRIEITRQYGITENSFGKHYSMIETGADLSDYDGPLTTDELESVKTEGITEYQEYLDYIVSNIISEFEIITSSSN